MGIKKYIPSDYVTSIFEIDYQSFKNQGYKTLFFDLDNTIINYDETEFDQKIIDFLQNLLKEFSVCVISNSRHKRVSKACNDHVPFIHFALKPFTFGLKRALKLTNSKAEETIFIGDQLMTDIVAANKMGILPILVKPVSRKTDHILTRLNRIHEKHVIKRIKSFDPDAYEKVIFPYEQNH